MFLGGSYAPVPRGQGPSTVKIFGTLHTPKQQQNLVW